jgi:DNA polymerase-3 subunit alpha
MLGIAITDHEALSAHVRAIRFVKEKKAEDKEWENFQLILGNEIYLTEDGVSSANVYKGQKYPHFILLAKNKEGHQQLRQLSSRAWERSFMSFLRRVPTYRSDVEEIVKANPGNLIATTACLGGPLGVMFQQDEQEKAEAFIQWGKSIFQKNFFLEMQPALYEDQKQYNLWLVELSNKYEVPLIITTDTHYLSKDKQDIHDAFLKSRDGERETTDFYQYTYMMSAEEIYKHMQYLPQEIITTALENTIKINEQIETYDLFSSQSIPKLKEPVIPDFDAFLATFDTEEYKYISFYKTSEDNDDRYLLYLVLQGMHDKIPVVDHREVLERINLELEELWEISRKINKTVGTYMLTLRNIINRAWDNCNSLVGVARGSAGAFIINYLIGVTQMNPLKQGVELPHWRFIQKDRPELPDIDIDTESYKRVGLINEIKKAAEEVGGTAVNICTFGTEGTKSAILTAARGLGIDIDIAQYLTTLIKQERGFLWSLQDCVHGNEEKDRKPIASLINEFSKYPQLLKVALDIEGIVCRLGVHPCGLVVFNEPSYFNNATMIAPNGLQVTQYDLGDSEYMGGLKFDLLSVEALDKIHTTLDLLLKDNLITWQGDLRKTYEKYIGVDSLEYEDTAMWKLLWQHKLLDGFQMDSAVAKQAIEKVRPSNIPELTAANSLMRLMPERGHEIPVDTYARFKKSPDLWIREMKNAGLNDNEIEVLKKHLAPVYGVANTQEEIMLLSMDPRIANFSVAEANELRKAVAKKKANVLSKVKKNFYKKGEQQEARPELLDYVWNIQIMKQAGYGFSIIHATAYSLIGLQELNLLYKYPPVYWATACLTVNSGGSFDTGECGENEQKGTTNYGKIASSIARIHNDGISVQLPDINLADVDFRPNVEDNSILYGLKGVAEIGNEFIETIKSNRPFLSLRDFLEKTQASRGQTVSLIKAGSFDKIERGKMRSELLYEYLSILVPLKQKITLQNFPKLIEHNLIPAEQNLYARIFNFNKYLKNFKEGEMYRLDERAYQFYTQHFPTDILNADKKGTLVPINNWNKIYGDSMEGIKDWLKENADILIKQLHAAEIDEIWQAVGKGTTSAWEMESVGFYASSHELINVTIPEVELSFFSKMPPEPKPVDFFIIKDRKIPIFDIKYIAGTVLDKNSIMKTITLATLEGVVMAKMSDDVFAKYSKQISIFNSETRKKEIIEKTWFKRGSLLILAGWRQGDRFMVRGKKEKGVFPVRRIIDIDDIGVAKVVKYRADD